MNKHRRTDRKPALPQAPQEGAPLAAWAYRAEDLHESGLALERTASPHEREAITSALDLVDCRRLSSRFTLQPLAGGRFRLEGDVGASVTQTCGITLEPVEEEVAEPFALEFWPAASIPEDARETEIDPFAEDAPEPIVDGVLDVGRIVFEHLAQGINPFPRKAGAELERRQADGGAAPLEESPFAALARLKGGPGAAPPQVQRGKPRSKPKK